MDNPWPGDDPNEPLDRSDIVWGMIAACIFVFVVIAVGALVWKG